MKGCVVISAAGMINAGRVKHHVFNAIEHEENTILIVGYCADNTPGGKLLRGDKMIRLFGRELEVKAKVERMTSFSAHGDYREMIDFLRTQEKKKLRDIYLVHGEKSALSAFKGHLENENYMKVNIAQLGESISL